MLKDWTAAAARMTAGQDAGAIGAVAGIPEAPPDDTGEALGLPPSGLTLTVGFGPTLFRDATGRTGSAWPPASRPRSPTCPHFPGDTSTRPSPVATSCVQACANDPQVAVHAIRNLARIGMGVVSVRWSQLGFGRTSSTSDDAGHAAQPVRLQGRHRQPQGRGDRPAAASTLWVPPGDGPDWMTGGSYLVTRKIRMLIETWDRTSLGEQETIIGRTKGEGAALGQAKEFDELDFATNGPTASR